MRIYLFRCALAIGVLFVINCDLGDLDGPRPPAYTVTQYDPPEPDPEPDPVLDSTNLITNGGFENQLTGWRFDADEPSQTEFTLSSDSYAGQNSLYANIQQLGPHDWYINTIWDPLALEEGVTYQISLWVKSLNETSRIKLAVGMNHDPWSDYSSTFCYTEEIWQQFSFDYTADESVANGSHLSINFDHLGEFFIDEVMVIKHEEVE